MTMIVYSSKRPVIIVNASKYLEKSLNPANDPDGPTAPKPGPTLLMLAIAAPNAVSKPQFSTSVKTSMMENVTTM